MFAKIRSQRSDRMLFTQLRSHVVHRDQMSELPSKGGGDVTPSGPTTPVQLDYNNTFKLANCCNIDVNKILQRDRAGSRVGL